MNKPLVIALAVVTLFAWLFFELWQGEKHAFVKYKSEVATIQKDLRDEQERKERNYQDIVRLYGSGWRAALDSVDGRPLVRVQRPTCPGVVPATAHAEQGTDGETSAAPDNSARIISAAQCEEDLTKGIKDAAQLYQLQNELIDLERAGS